MRKLISLLTAALLMAVLAVPASAQEDEALFSLSILYSYNKQPIPQLITLIKLHKLHPHSPLIVRSSIIVDSLITYSPELLISEKNEQAIRNLNNISKRNDYKNAYLDFLSFLQTMKQSIP